MPNERECSGCYNSFSGWWCDNCDRWPCVCNPELEVVEATLDPKLIEDEDAGD